MSSQISVKDCQTPAGMELMTQHTITTKIIETKLKCNDQAIMELEKIELYNFNIFNL